jgi:hypothetical protein
LPAGHHVESAVLAVKVDDHAVAWLDLDARPRLQVVKLEARLRRCIQQKHADDVRGRR